MVVFGGGTMAVVEWHLWWYGSSVCQNNLSSVDHKKFTLAFIFRCTKVPNTRKNVCQDDLSGKTNRA